MKIDKRNPHHWILLAQQGIYTLAAAVMRFALGKPKKPLVILYGHQLSGNLKALHLEWQSHFQDQFDCYFLSLDPEYSRKLENQGVRLLRCSRFRDMILVGRCDAMITDHGLHAMQPFISLTNIIFIDVWHGIPFKGFIPEDFRVQQRYDEVWVSSPLLKELYQTKFGFRSETVLDLGYARTDRLFRREAPDSTFRHQFSIPTDHRIVLYAPTWQQDDKGRELFPFGESQESFITALNAICSDHRATLVIRTHLNASIGAKTSDNVRYCSMKDFPDTEGLLLHTDVLICDWSSIAFDFLALDRPTIFLDVPPPFRNGLTLASQHRFGAVVSNLESLNDGLSSILIDPQFYFAIQRSKHQEIVRRVYGKSTDGKVAKRQLEHLTNSLNQVRNEICEH